MAAAGIGGHHDRPRVVEALVMLVGFDWTSAYSSSSSCAMAPASEDGPAEAPRSLLSAGGRTSAGLCAHSARHAAFCASGRGAGSDNGRTGDRMAYDDFQFVDRRHRRTVVMF